MENINKINVEEFIDSNALSPMQWFIFIITCFISFFDGFDAAAIGFVAPDVLREWNIDRTELTPVLTAALIGLAIGAFAFGPVADKIGRKKVMVLTIAIFSVGSIATGMSTNLSQLELFRFITGIGLGAALPNSVTLLSEYCPAKKRYVLVNTMYCAFPVGAALGGFVAAWMVPHLGWRSLLLLGGICPAIIVVVMIFCMPESVRFLVLKQKNNDVVRNILTKISNTASEATDFFIEEATQNISKKSGISVILSKQYVIGTIVLCLSYFTGLLVFYAVLNWLPLLFSEYQEIPKWLGPIVSGLFALGGLGAIVSGYLMNRFDACKLIILFWISSAISLSLVGVSINISVWLAVFFIIIAGITVNTAATSLPSFAANFYPTAGRTTGVSWMLGVGKFGGITGTLMVGKLLGADLTIVGIFIIIGLTTLISAIAFVIYYFVYNKK